MKNLMIAIACVVGAIFQSHAQEPFFKESLNGIKKVEITASTEMTVITGSANELQLAWGSNCDGCKKKKGNNEWEHENWDNDWEESRDKEREDRKKGMRAIYASGEDNTGMGMFMERDGDVLRIRDLKPITQRKAFTITIPKTVNLHVDTSTLGSVYVKGLSTEVSVKSNVGDVQLVDVTGPITASTATGTIDVIFTNVNQDAPVSLTTATGVIDVSLPSNTKANVEMKSTMGTVYSNFDLEKPREDGMKNISGNRKIKGQLNSGGVKIYLSSSTGDIFLRKRG